MCERTNESVNDDVDQLTGMGKQHATQFVFSAEWEMVFEIEKALSRQEYQFVIPFGQLAICDAVADVREFQTQLARSYPQCDLRYAQGYDPHRHVKCHYVCV
jgi:hypothetical protein